MKQKNMECKVWFDINTFANEWYNNLAILVTKRKQNILKNKRIEIEVKWWIFTNLLSLLIAQFLIGLRNAGRLGHDDWSWSPYNYFVLLYKW